MTPKEIKKLTALLTEWELEARAWPVDVTIFDVLTDSDASRRAMVRCAMQLRQTLEELLKESDRAELLKHPVFEPFEQNAKSPGG